MKSLISSSSLFLTFRIQYTDQSNALQRHRTIPVKFALLRLLKLPCEDITTTPAKLTNNATPLFHPILCFNIGIESKTNTIGHVILIGCATCAGKSEYPLNRMI